MAVVHLYRAVSCLKERSGLDKETEQLNKIRNKVFAQALAEKQKKGLEVLV